MHHLSKMRKSLLLCLQVCVSAQTAYAGELAALKGPAAGTIRNYLESQQTECPSDPDKKCSLAGVTIDARLTYGRFPRETRTVAVLFLSEETGGSGAATEVFVWAAKPNARFDLMGKIGDAIGGEIRDVRFRQDGIIEYTGTVMAKGDMHANPSGKKVFQLRLEGESLYFRGPK